jgi:threonine dehydrogenase-like Zn-dependent dehydrogenase
MRATVLHSPGHIAIEDVPEPQLQLDTDAIVRVVASCICGSDLWPYRGIGRSQGPTRIGHEFVGVVEQVGAAVRSLALGDFVIAPFAYSDNTCIRCRQGIHTSCENGGWWGAQDRSGHLVDGGQGELVRVPCAEGTLVKTPGEPAPGLIPHLLTLSDVFPTGHHAAVSAGVTLGSRVVVVGDGAVGLCAVRAAKRLGAQTVIAMSRHPVRQELAIRFGADDVVAARGKDGADAVWRLLGDVGGADCVLECVGTNESMRQAMLAVRPGGTVGYVGVPHDVELNVPAMFGRNIGLVGGVAPVRAYLDELLPEVWSGALEPGAVFDERMPLDDVAQGYRAMDERTAVKVLLEP